MRTIRTAPRALALLALNIFAALSLIAVGSAAARSPGRPILPVPSVTTLADEPRTFPTPDAALQALREAAAAKDKSALDALFGPVAKEIMNPDPVQHAIECEAFSMHLAEMASLVRQSDDKVILHLGQENWPFPAPIVRKDGKWSFDMVAGKDEILSRRIGENELNTIDVCRAYVVAQREFHEVDWNNDDILEYAQHLKSSAEKKDGLYWPASQDETQSPLGPLVAEARAEGYFTDRTPEQAKLEGRRPFHGYVFKILTKQGEHAPGGAYDYVINGHMIAGFALLAYPAEWGNTGVMSFIVGPRGKVYQANLGEKTAQLAPDITTYDPDSAWKPVSE